jgi:hypothetical protein
MVSRLLEYLKSIIWAKKETDAVDDKAFRRIDGKKSRVFAVDGGNGLICDGGTWSISKIKTVVVGYEDGKRIKEEIVFNCFVLIRKDGDIQFDEEIKTPAFDFKNIKFEDVPSELRKILEYMTAVKVIDRLKADRKSVV